MEIRKTVDGSKLVLAPVGKLDAMSAPELGDIVRKELDGVTELGFDLSELTYTSSAGLRVFISAQKIMSKQGSMYICNVCDEIKEVFELVGFNDIFDIR
ncbi:MAG: STAS domain-containing protein [Mogibacterium sp.]|nr:STAS domain-containing protein [Mogibacterium sp.]